ncbi:unnamed protein product [Thlaspi arvense]|uniref:SHSP domain-containing protein n=1 Tax=Thlaspi arvense TaxID=13288 RepID=A0AAU9RVW4_THLAR|nr:unnamed protein product [Thlaspi arvense]
MTIVSVTLSRFLHTTTKQQKNSVVSRMSKAGSSSGVNNIPAMPAKNRFSKSGSEEVYEVKETNTCLFYRVDMPGCPFYDVKRAKAKLLNGVLWLTVPKVSGKSIELDVTEKMLYN